MEDFKDLRVWAKAHEHIQANTDIPERGDVRIDQPTATRLLFNWSKHCGRMWSEIRCRDEEVPSNCARFGERSGIPPVARQGSAISYCRRVQRFGGKGARSAANAGLARPACSGSGFSKKLGASS